MIGPTPVIIDPAGSDIHAEAARIRAQGPVSQVVLPGGVVAWSITSHDVARQALSDSRFSKDPRKHWTAYIDGKVGDFPLIGWVLMDNLTTRHGKDHTRLRQLTSSAFTPRRVEAMRPGVQAAVDDLLGQLSATGPGAAVDIKARFAHPLPARVICDLFGVPEELRAPILRGGEMNVNTTITPEESAANVQQWRQQILDFVESKRRNPGDDLTTGLIEAQQDDGSRLSPDEMADTLHILLATGTEPVMNLITNAIFALLTHPEQRDHVTSGRVSWRDLIEETLRAEAPVAHLPFRYATEDIEIGGVTIPKGDPVLMGYAAVGRDPAVHHETADRFDVTRANKDHLSFGAGIYRCIGKQLALLEAEAALSSLFRRFPGMTFAVPPEDVEPQVTFIMNGRKSLPVHLSPVPARTA